VSLGTGHNFLRYTYYTCSTYPTCSQALVGLRVSDGTVGHVLQTNPPQSSDHRRNPAGNLICTQHAAKSLRKVRKSSPWALHSLNLKDLIKVSFTPTVWVIPDALA